MMASNIKLSRLIKSRLHSPLLYLFIISVLLLFSTHENSIIRTPLCNLGICFYSASSNFWNSLFYDLSAGCVIAIIFYWVLVRWPEYRKRQRTKRNLSAQYKAFKTACIENFLAVADGSFNHGTAEKLIDVESFRDYFNQDVGNGKERWDDVHNNMSQYYLDVTLSRMEIMKQEISFAMQTIDFSESESFEILKRFSHAITMQRNATDDYDELKSFLGIFWELFAGQSFDKGGYRDTDLIEDIIAAI